MTARRSGVAPTEGVAADMFRGLEDCVRAGLGLAWVIGLLAALPALAEPPAGAGASLAVRHTADGRSYTLLEGAYTATYESSGPDIDYGFAAKVTRVAGGVGQLTVGAQLNGWSGPGVSSQTFGAAIEAVAMLGSRSILIGTETLVGNFDPMNVSTKIANNAVFVNKPLGGANSATRNNANSIAYWVTATAGTGFETALKLDRNSIADSDVRQASVIDLSELEDLDVVVFRLPQGTVITLRQLMALGAGTGTAR